MKSMIKQYLRAIAIKKFDRKEAKLWENTKLEQKYW